MHHAFGKSINILNGEYGNGILSKYPIEEYEVIDLPSEGEQRTLLRAGLKVHGYKLFIYSTHLGLKQSERSKQIEEIMRISGNDKNLLLAGDFNTSVDKLDSITTRLIDSGGMGNNSSKATFEEDGMSERIDYIFFSNSFAVKGYNVIKADASDHYPVVSILKFED
jgi:endonuclease/exonuclease/phosphatase family metal-dependent hydrolase